jgi:hypothetical protein
MADWQQSPEKQSGEEAPCPAAHLVQSDNHREAPWLLMTGAQESGLLHEATQSDWWMIV